ncbi:MAG: OmpA family protein [Amaricoccus sp.]
MKQAVYAAATFAAWVACGAVAQAQGMTDAELVQRFRAQMQSIKAAETPGADRSMGATRGLVLTAPGEEPAAQVQVETAAPAEGLTLTPVPDAATNTAADGSEPAPTMTHWELPKDEQVNVQVTFAFDSSALDDAQKPKLAQICEVLGAAGVNVMRIVGHTDASGPWGYNQKLSELRAQEVMRFFVDSCGIPADKLQAVGVGEQFPFDDKNPRAGVNRRVEFQAIS